MLTIPGIVARLDFDCLDPTTGPEFRQFPLASDTMGGSQMHVFEQFIRFNPGLLVRIALMEPVLRPVGRQDNRGRPWHETHGVEQSVLDAGSGTQWRELPERYPPYQTCHRHFQQ